MSNSRVVRAIKGDDKENNEYLQENYYNQTNNERINSVKNKILKEGYPYNDEYIVLFNNQNLIRDGQHRASVMLNSGSYNKVTVIRMLFNDNKYNSSLHPWVKELFLLPLKKTIKKGYRLFSGILNKIKRILM